MLAMARAGAQEIAPIAQTVDAQVNQLPTGSASYRVLSIGITKYDELPSLEFTTNDARNFVRAYSEVGGVGEDKLTLLVDDGRDAEPLTSQAVESSALQFLRSCSSRETAILFFSGHGVRLDSGFSLAASDFHSPESATGAIPMDRLRSALALCAAKSKIVILDCCHSGSFGAAPSDIASSFRSVPGCVVIAASRPSEASLETHSLRSGIFTHWLVAGMRGAANTKIDGVIDATELFDFVSQGVRATTSSMQTPAIAFDQSTTIPAIIELRHPDRPSDRVGIIAFPLPPEPDTLSIVLDSIIRFPEANPRRTIGLCHWVLKHSPANSPATKQAESLIDEINELILAGKVALGPKEGDEEPARSFRPGRRGALNLRSSDF